MLRRSKPDDLDRLYKSLQKYWAQAHGEAEIDIGLYDQLGSANTKMDMPAGLSYHIPSTPTQIVDNMTDQLTLEHPVISMPPKGSPETVSKLTAWATEQLRFHRLAFDPAKKDILGAGGGAIKLILNEAVLPPVPAKEDGESDEDFEKRMIVYQQEKQACNPYLVTSIPILTFYPAPGAPTPLPYALEVQYKTVLDMTEFTTWTDPKGRAAAEVKDFDTVYDDGRRVLWLEFWSAPTFDNDGEMVDPGWYIIEVDGERIVEVENPYGFVPYFFRFSGLGRQDPSGDPKFQMKGLLSKIRGELEAEVRVKTAIEAQYQYHVFPTLLVERDAAKAAQMMRRGPGKVLEWGGLGSKPEWLETPPPNEQMMTFLNQVQQSMTRVTAPVLQGAGASEYGILEAMRVGNALKVVAPVSQALNRMASDLLTGMAKLARLRNLSFKVAYGADKSATLNGESFKRYDFEVSFERNDAAENERRMLVGQQLRASREISNETFLRDFAKTADPAGEQERILQEKLIDRAVDGGMLDPFLASKVGQAGPAQAGAEAAGLAGQLGLPPGGAPAPVAPMEAQAEAAAGSPGLANERVNGGAY